MVSSFRERLDAWNQCVAMLLFFGAIGPIGTLVLMTSPHVAKVDRDVWMVVGLFCIMFFGGLIMRAVGPCLIEEPEDGNFGDWSALYRLKTQGIYPSRTKKHFVKFVIFTC